MPKYSIGDRVEGTIKQVEQFGVFIELDDGITGYIRRRELDLDLDVIPEDVASKGERIAGKVIHIRDDKNLELSHRNLLPNPWPDFVRQHREGTVIQGIVQRLMPYGAFVRVQAGINGLVPLAELSTQPVEKPEEVLWVGDLVEAVISDLDTHNERMTLSIKARLDDRDQAARLLEQINPQSASLPLALTTPSLEIRFTSLECERIGTVIVLDDSPEITQGLTNRLKRLGLNAQWITTIAEAIPLVEQINVGVCFIDLNLSDGDGVQIVRHLRDNASRARICVMSDQAGLAERAEELRTVSVDQIFAKPLHLEEVDEMLSLLARGETISPIWQRTETKESQDLTQLRQFFDAKSANRLVTSLVKLTERMQAEKGILFALDPTTQSLGIVAEAGNLPVNQKAIYEIADTPVNDVIKNDKPIFSEHAGSEPRFRKFQNLIAFESCIGVPIEVMGEIQHAVFFFHRQPSAFSTARQRGAMFNAIWLGTLLEAQALDQRLRASSPLLLSGQLAQGMAHEVSNKATGLDLQVLNLLSTTDSTALQIGLQNFRSSTSDLKNLVESFQKMMQAQDTRVPLQVNDILHQAANLTDPIARKEGAKFVFQLADHLPTLNSNDSALRQVFVNLMLNAAQQMALKAKRLAWKGKRLLEINTQYKETTDIIQIEFRDTGPGIHKELWEKVFTPGFSTRGGSGLGLYIARSLVERLGGEICVAESYVPLGTTFLIKLPGRGDVK